ncbi:glycosyl hydrolase [uncultured Polaribacter sp.]|uniref:glycosyl hydrolase n=1 Tax=uncultured Polaribacter sp. TaxID=174711 RepID=UPI002612D64F|nr:glycosyl hydrolase [uncultured Polaribacter sp.]
MKFFLKTLCLFLLVVSCSEQDDFLLNEESKLLSFSIKAMENNFDISSNNMVSTTLKDEQDLSKLTAIFEVSENAKVYVGKTLQASGFSENDFSNNPIYIVEAEDGTRTRYTIMIGVAAKLTEFKIVELNNTTFTIDSLSITAKVPAGTDLKNVTAKFDVTENSTLNIGGIPQESEVTKNDFSNPIIYTLVGQNGDSKQYTVTITEAPNNEPTADAGSDKIVILSNGNSTVKVNLDASASSDTEGPLASFEWRMDGNIIGNSELSTIDLELGNYSIELIVTDSSGATATTTINIEVRMQGIYTPIDVNATTETINLYNNIANIANSSQFAFGQEFPMSFQLGGLRTDLSTSDAKDVVGDHPAVYGIDPNYLMYKSAQQREVHINEAKYAYNNGSVVTMDFHQQSKTDGKIYMRDITTETDKSLMYDVVNNLNGSRDWFYGELDEVLGIVNDDLGFPVVFRLFHEMDGDWFWWGKNSKNHSPQLYIDFYKMAADYMKERTNLVLFAWTPNQKIEMSYYPGDTYVDVVGIDVYNPVKAVLKSNLIELSTFALDHGKIAILSETGKVDYVNTNPTFWTSNVLAAIQEGGSDIRIAWALAWFNAPWNSSQSDLYIPNSDSPAVVKEDFISFYNSPLTLFQQELDNLNIYN